MKQLPISIQTFRNLREGNYVYVDKTAFVYNLTKGVTGSYFLSRPRRFGKSLLLNTFKELFLGSEELFRGLWIHDKWDWSQSYPVIHLSFDAVNYQNGFENAISHEMKKWAEHYQIELATTHFKDQFEELLKKLYAQKGKIVLLIDEYDKPIVDYLERLEMPQARENQKIMKTFYSVLKNAEPQLRFLFITGVSKFTKVSLFSDLNHVKDLTLDKNYTTMLGYTQTELEANFSDYIDKAAESFEMSRAELLDRMRIQYNGFSWDGINTVYNPFGTLNFLDQESFANFWFISGMPSFLLKLMRERLIFDVENTKINSVDLERYDIENIDLVPLLFQTGYLTVKHFDRRTQEMRLGYPNQEVQESFYQYMIDGLAKEVHRPGAYVTNKDLLEAFHNADLDRVKELLNALLAGLPSEAFDKKSEGLYHGLIHFVFQLLSIYIKSEVHSSRGRADSVVETATHVFIFEFKFKKTAAEALTQIKNKKYADKYRADNKTIIGIGVNFNPSEREIDDWETELL